MAVAGGRLVGVSARPVTDLASQPPQLRVLSHMLRPCPQCSRKRVAQKLDKDGKGRAEIVLSQAPLPWPFYLGIDSGA